MIRLKYQSGISLFCSSIFPIQSKSQSHSNGLWSPSESGPLFVTFLMSSAVLHTLSLLSMFSFSLFLSLSRLLPLQGLSVCSSSCLECSSLKQLPSFLPYPFQFSAQMSAGEIAPYPTRASLSSLLALFFYVSTLTIYNSLIYNSLIFIVISLSPLEGKLHPGKDFSLFCSLSSTEKRTLCMHSLCSANFCWSNVWTNNWIYFNVSHFIVATKSLFFKNINITDSELDWTHFSL